MTGRLTFVIAMFAIVLTIAADASAQNGPYYATPAWDQTFPCTTTSNCPRFVVLSNFNDEAVLDRETGLVWMRSSAVFDSDTVMPWTAAEVTCQGIVVGGRLGWRLPSVSELTSLLDGSSNNTLPAGHPFTSIPNLVWSGTISQLSVESTLAAVVAFFGATHPVEFLSLDVPAGALCVRGPSPQEGR